MGKKEIQRFLVRVMSIALKQHVSIPTQPKSLKRVENVFGRPWDFPWRIQIFNAYQPLALVRPRIEATRNGRGHRPQVQPARGRRGKTSYVRTTQGHPRTSFLYLMRLGPSSPSRFFLFSSYSLYVPSNQYAWLSPSNARMWVQMRSRK